MTEVRYEYYPGYTRHATEALRPPEKGQELKRIMDVVRKESR